MSTNISTNDKNVCQLYSSQIKQIYYILDRSIIHKHNNSALLISNHGTPKFECLNESIKRFQKNNKKFPFVKIYLNGLFHLTMETALKEIYDKLEVTIKEGTFKKKLLNLKEVLESYHNPIILIINHFEEFIANKINLVYSILDLMQENQINISIIALTTSYNNFILEKRIRSRFSYDKILFENKISQDEERIKEAIITINSNNNKNAKKPITHIDILNKDYLIEELNGLSLLELLLVILMIRLEIKKYPFYNFRSIINEYKVIKSKHEIFNYNNLDMIYAFTSLIDINMVYIESNDRIKLEYSKTRILIDPNEGRDYVRFSMNDIPIWLKQLLLI